MEVIERKFSSVPDKVGGEFVAGGEIRRGREEVQEFKEFRSSGVRLEGSRFGMCLSDPICSVESEDEPKRVVNKRLP